MIVRPEALRPRLAAGLLLTDGYDVTATPVSNPTVAKKMHTATPPAATSLKQLTNHVDKVLRDGVTYVSAVADWKGDAIRIRGAEKESGQTLDFYYYGDLDDVYEYLVAHLYSTYAVQ